MPTISQSFIDENDWVARYLADQLSDTERASFEAYYLEHPELVKELNRTAQFKSGLIDLQRSGALRNLLTPKPRWQDRSNLAVAASLVLVVIGVVGWLSWQSASSPLIAGSITGISRTLHSPPSLASSYVLQRTRASSYDATITLPSESSAIEFRLKPDRADHGRRYQVTIASVGANDSTRDVASIHDLELTADGFVPVFVNSAQIAAGVYELRVAPSQTRRTMPTDKESTAFLVEFVAAPR